MLKKETTAAAGRNARETGRKRITSPLSTQVLIVEEDGKKASFLC